MHLTQKARDIITGLSRVVSKKVVLSLYVGFFKNRRSVRRAISDMFQITEKLEVPSC